jgi:pilus assembly protein Flp/PilA
MNRQLNREFVGIRDSLAVKLREFHSDEAAATATEYIILLILVACFIIAIVRIYGQTMSLKMEEADAAVVTEVTF